MESIILKWLEKEEVEILIYDILVVEDDEDIIKLLKIYLEGDGYRVISAENGIDALKIIENIKVDLVVMDIMMPKMDGYELTKKIREKYTIPIIILSAKNKDSDKIYGLNLGADDYIVKPFRTRELISRIKSVLRRYGQKEENSNIIQYKNIKIDTTAEKVYKDNEEIIFTSLEYKILLMLFTNQNKLITREQLLDKIWDIAGNFVNDNTLTVYIKRIREKLEDETIIKTVRGLGYRIGD